MSKRAYFPLYIGDYLGDTGHLTTTQHGAYLLLMLHYWRVGELPSEDKQLAAITKLPLRLWLDCKETIQAFFYNGWHHKRIDAELSKMVTVSEKRSAAGIKGGLRSAMNRMILEDAANRSNCQPIANQLLRPSSRANAQANASVLLEPGSTTNTKKESKTSTGLSVERAQARQGTVASPELMALLAKG